MEKVSHTDVVKAKELIEKFEDQLSDSFVDSKFCAVCKENQIKAFEGKPRLMDQEKHMWSGGTVERVSFGYGSDHDGETFFIAICDTCIGELDSSGHAVSLHDLKRRKEAYIKMTK